MIKFFVWLLAMMVLPVFGQTAVPAQKPLEIRALTPGVYLHTSFKHIEGYGLVDSNVLI